MELALEARPKSRELPIFRNTPFLDVKLRYKNKTVRARAVLDTGAADIYVPKGVVEKLGLKISDLERGTRFYGVKEGKTTYPFVLDEMSLPDAPGCRLGPVYARTSRIDPIGVILLGRPFIRAAGMKITFERFKDTFRLLCPRRDVTARETGRPVQLDDPRSMFRRFTFKVGGKAMTGPCFVDTGATVTLLPLWLSRDLGVRTRAVPLRAGGAAGSFTVLVGEIDGMTLVGTSCVHQGPVRVLVSPHARIPIVGVDFFWATGTTIDFAESVPKISCS